MSNYHNIYKMSKPRVIFEDGLTFVPDRFEIEANGIDQTLMLKVYNWRYGRNFETQNRIIPDIKKVIFNGPATIVFWDDNTKTVVKCSDGDIYDKRVAILYAIGKKMCGNNSQLNKLFDKYIPEEEKKPKKKPVRKTTKKSKK